MASKARREEGVLRPCRRHRRDARHRAAGAPTVRRRRSSRGGVDRRLPPGEVVGRRRRRRWATNGIGRHRRRPEDALCPDRRRR